MLLGLLVAPRGTPALRPVCRTGMRWGLRLGALTFAVGFVGPVLWSPESNQGPLLGIFITGPIGFVVGSLAGLVAGSSDPTADLD